MFNRIIISILPLIVKAVTPEIKKTAKNLLKDLRSRAEATPNPYDDVFVDILDELLAD